MEGPLQGVRVLDLSFFLAGPFAGHILADLGADVIKVEPPEGDPSRRGQGLAPGTKPNSQFIAIQRNKRSIVVDLKNASGRHVLYQLVGASDILLENYRPGVTARLGINYDALKAINSGLIYCTITGFGSSGPLAQKAAYDSIIQALSGATLLTGGSDRPPTLMGIFMGDLAAPCFAVHAILAALYRRERSGEGAHIDMSMLESLLYLAPSQTQD